MQVKIQQATSMVTDFIKAGIVPMLHGSPGIGKSQVVQQIADEYGLELVDLRLSQCDPTDLAGFPQIDAARQKAGYLPMDTFPLEGEQPSAGKNGWLLFFDEANSAPKAVQAAAYKILLDRKIGQRSLHKNCALVAAGNLETDGAIVEEMSTALQSRLAHIELQVDAEQWVQWAQRNGVHHMITSYIQFKPSQLYTFRPDHTDKTYACPRTWEFANRVMKVTAEDSPNRLPMLASTLSEGVAREFRTFCKIFDSLPKIPEIIRAPDTIKVPTEPSILYALTGALSHNATTANFTSLMEFIKRLPVEFQVVTMRETVRRNKAMMSHAAVQKWVTESATTLF